MGYDLKRYPLDETGSSPDNLISGEPHELSSMEIRAVCPTYGAYYTASLRIYDVDNARWLDKGIDWRPADLLQDITVKTGMEVSMMFIVINTSVSSNIKITYQVVGGEYVNMDSTIANLYETIMKDTRAVDWLNIINKPLEFNPTMHRHMLEDVYGFEYVVAALERIRNAILMSDVPAFEYVLTLIDERVSTINARITDEVEKINAFLALERQILVKGPKVIWNDSVTDFIITNYSDWMTYDVVGNGVTVSRESDVVHVTTDNRIGAGSFTITATAPNGFVANSGTFDFQIIAHVHQQCSQCITDTITECTHVQCSDCIVNKTTQCNTVECKQNVVINTECDQKQCNECYQPYGGTKTVQCSNCITDMQAECFETQCTQCLTRTSGECNEIECRGLKECSECNYTLSDCISMNSAQCTQCSQCFSPKAIECYSRLHTAVHECYSWGTSVVVKECVQCSSSAQCRQCSTYASPDCDCDDGCGSCHNADGD